MKTQYCLQLIAGLFVFFMAAAAPSFAKPGEDLNKEVLAISPSSKRSPLQMESWKLSAGVRGTYYEDRFNRDSLTALLLKAEGRSQLTHRLNLDANISGVFEQGTAQGLKQQSTRRDSGFYLNQVRLSYDVMNWMTLDAGALSQRRYMSPLLAYSGSYPALRQNMDVRNNSWQWSFSSQQAIPTSQKLSSKAIQKEDQPIYLTAAISAQKTWPFGTQMRFIPGIYQFHHLPSAVAYESCLIGNSVIGKCAPGARFAYNFFGTDTYADIMLNLPHEWTITLGGNYLQNFEAPAGRAQGALYELDFNKGLNVDLALGWSFLYFEKQSDVTPAFYAPFMYENNRKGYGAKFRFSFSRRQIELKGTFLQTTPLKTTAIQNSTVNYVRLSLETSYESL